MGDAARAWPSFAAWPRVLESNAIAPPAPRPGAWGPRVGPPLAARDPGSPVLARGRRRLSRFVDAEALFDGEPPLRRRAISVRLCSRSTRRECSATGLAVNTTSPGAAGAAGTGGTRRLPLPLPFSLPLPVTLDRPRPRDVLRRSCTADLPRRADGVTAAATAAVASARRTWDILRRGCRVVLTVFALVRDEESSLSEPPRRRDRRLRPHVRFLAPLNSAAALFQDDLVARSRRRRSSAKQGSRCRLRTQRMVSDRLCGRVGGEVGAGGRDESQPHEPRQWLCEGEHGSRARVLVPCTGVLSTEYAP